MAIKVYHNKLFLSTVINEKPVLLRQCTHVATVETNDLDEAFRLTNHIDSIWMENPKVTVVVNKNLFVVCPDIVWMQGEQVKVLKEKLRYRSTSVGDLMIEENGKEWVVDTVGFTRRRTFNKRIKEQQKDRAKAISDLYDFSPHNTRNRG